MTNPQPACDDVPVQELKGNIRVFCRVRPPLLEDEKESAGEPPILQYPTSAELAGRGVELVPAAGEASSLINVKPACGEIRISALKKVDWVYEYRRSCLSRSGETHSATSGCRQP